MLKIMKSMNMIARCQSLYRGERSPSDDILPSHFGFVLCITGTPGASQEEIADRLCLNKSTVARAVAQLVERGYARREPCESDKRAFKVYPTERMLEILPRIKECNSEWNELISEGIDEGELRVFYSVLIRMEESAKCAVKPTRVTKKEDMPE